jgi:hypothetical protein
MILEHCRSGYALRSAVNLRRHLLQRLGSTSGAAVQLHFADVHVIPGPGKDRLQHKGLRVVCLQIAIAVHADIAFACFGAMYRRVEKVLRLGNAGCGAILASCQALGGL